MANLFIYLLQTRNGPNHEWQSKTTRNGPYHEWQSKTTYL